MDMVMNVAWLVGLVYTRYEAAVQKMHREVEAQMRNCHFPQLGYHNEQCYRYRCAGVECIHQMEGDALVQEFASNWHTNDAHIIHRDQHLWDLARYEEECRSAEDDIPF